MQGILVGQKPDGRLIVRVDQQVFVGHPVETMRPMPPAATA